MDITICYGASKVGLGGVLIKKERSFDLYLKIVWRTMRELPYSWFGVGGHSIFSWVMIKLFVWGTLGYPESSDSLVYF